MLSVISRTLISPAVVSPRNSWLSSNLNASLGGVLGNVCTNFYIHSSRVTPTRFISFHFKVVVSVLE